MLHRSFFFSLSPLPVPLTGLQWFGKVNRCKCSKKHGMKLADCDENNAPKWHRQCKIISMEVNCFSFVNLNVLLGFTWVECMYWIVPGTESFQAEVTTQEGNSSSYLSTYSFNVVCPKKKVVQPSIHRCVCLFQLVFAVFDHSGLEQFCTLEGFWTKSSKILGRP